MNTGEKLEELARRCKGSVTVEINEHRSNYESVESCLSYIERHGHRVSPEISAEMIRRDRMVCVTAYVFTSVGNYSVFHYDVDEALDTMLEIAPMTYDVDTDRCPRCHAYVISDKSPEAPAECHACEWSGVKCELVKLKV